MDPAPPECGAAFAKLLLRAPVRPRAMVFAGFQGRSSLCVQPSGDLFFRGDGESACFALPPRLLLSFLSFLSLAPTHPSAARTPQCVWMDGRREFIRVGCWLLLLLRGGGSGGSQGWRGDSKGWIDECALQVRSPGLRGERGSPPPMSYAGETSITPQPGGLE